MYFYRQDKNRQAEQLAQMYSKWPYTGRCHIRRQSETIINRNIIQVRFILIISFIEQNQVTQRFILT